MRHGRLFFNADLGRMDIDLGGDYYKGLHCGECFDAKILDEWIPVRVEYDHAKKEWYLVHAEGAILDSPLEDLTVRIPS